MHECEALGESPFGPLSLTVWLAPGPAESNPSMPAGAAALGPASGSSQPQPLLPAAAAMPSLFALDPPAARGLTAAFTPSSVGSSQLQLPAPAAATAATSSLLTLTPPEARGPTAAFTPSSAGSSPLQLLASAAVATAPQLTVTVSPRRLSAGSEGTDWGDHVLVCDRSSAGSSDLTLPITPVSHAPRRVSSGAVRRRTFSPTKPRQPIWPTTSKQYVIRGGRPVIKQQHSGMHVQQPAIRKQPITRWQRSIVMRGGLPELGSAVVGGMRPARPVVYISRTASLHSARRLAVPIRGGRRAMLSCATPLLPPIDVVMEVELEEEDMDEGETDMEEGKVELEESDVEMDEDEVMEEAGEEYSSSLEAMQEDGEGEEEAHIGGIMCLDNFSVAGFFTAAAGVPSSLPSAFSAGAASALSPPTAFSAGAATSSTAPFTSFGPMTASTMAVTVFTPAGVGSALPPSPPLFSAAVGAVPPISFSPATDPTPLPISAASLSPSFSWGFSDEEAATISCLLELGTPAAGRSGLAEPRFFPQPQPHPDLQSTLVGPVVSSGSPPGPQADPALAPAPRHHPPSRQVPLAHRSFRPVLRPGQAPPRPRPCSNNGAVH